MLIWLTRKPILREWNHLLSDQRNCERVTLKIDAFINFVVNPEKCIDTIFKNLVDCNSM